MIATILRGTIAGLSLVALAFPPNTASAGEEPCKVVLCMFGELKGASGGSACQSSIAQYFSIIKTKKKGKFDPAGTAQARLSFLNKCSDNTTGEKEQINEKYGQKRGL